MTQTMQPSPQTQQAQPVYEITDSDRARQKRIAEAWTAYNGELEPPLKPMEDGTDDNVLTNRCQAIVDRGVDFLFGKELDIACEKGAPTDAQDELDSIWGETEARIPLLQELGMNGACGGNAFLRIVPDGAGAYELVTVDPAIVVGIKTAPQNCNRVLLYCIQYSESQKINGTPREVYYREEIAANYPDTQPGKPTPSQPQSWSIGHWTYVSQKGAAPKLGEWTAAGPPIAWNYPFPPLFHCKNLPMPNSAWGKPDITPDLIGTNKALNRLLSGINATEGLFGEPLLYAVDSGESTIRRERGRIIALPLATSKIEAVHIASDVAPALAFAADLRSDIDEQSGVPGVATGRISTLPRGALSGITIELLHSPIIKKTDKKRCLYGKLIIDVSQALLILNKMSGDIKITLAWQDPLPHDDLVSAQAAVTKLELGVSKTTVLRGLGEDPENEAKIRTSPTEIALNTAVTPPMPPEEPGAPPLPGQQKPAPTPVPGQAPAPVPASPFVGRQP
jgi:hypothetical protein